MMADPTERLAKKTRIRALFEKYGDIAYIFGFPGPALKRQAIPDLKLRRMALTV
ncbi:MAG: hypothetical protein LBG22_03450 [Treponema sp.]|jgi:hypothetical protein|nr:hypothetical protein [Treponema sp.]